MKILVNLILRGYLVNVVRGGRSGMELDGDIDMEDLK
jgi:hypothetical protein